MTIQKSNSLSSSNGGRRLRDAVSPPIERTANGAERRSGYVILLLGSLLGSGVPVIHMMGKGVGAIAKSSGGFFFVWTLLALGVTAVFSLILSARGLWSLRRGQPR